MSRPDFATMPIVLEDFLREHGASYTGVLFIIIINRSILARFFDKHYAR